MRRVGWRHGLVALAGSGLLVLGVSVSAAAASSATPAPIPGCHTASGFVAYRTATGQITRNQTPIITHYGTCPPGTPAYIGPGPGTVGWPGNAEPPHTVP